ncbi:hypothetical protein BJ165DRAFT_1534236 [Panaeolus papilionaceus]|nr:hypothetical protein BJ165DRAFT_1534236 [Panaeolus papilionaceus]
MSMTTEIVVPQFGNTLGALLLGGTLATALWGVTCIQIYNYYMDVNKDPPWLKFLVAMLW